LGLVLAILGAVLSMRQAISVDPYKSYDSKEAFQQQFTITNNGPFAIYNVHYTCAVSGVKLNDDSFSGFPDWFGQVRVIWVMVPIKPNLPVLDWMEKTNTECDFIGRFGPKLKSANVEIDVSYRRWLRKSEIVTIGGRFSGQRDSEGNFVWVYGSNAISPIKTIPGIPIPPKTVTLVIPF